MEVSSEDKDFLGGGILWPWKMLDAGTPSLKAEPRVLEEAISFSMRLFRKCGSPRNILQDLGCLSNWQYTPELGSTSPGPLRLEPMLTPQSGIMGSSSMLKSEKSHNCDILRDRFVMEPDS